MGEATAAFPEIPEIETILIDEPGTDSDGETASIPTAAAIGNAIFDATGVRLMDVTLIRQREPDVHVREKG